MKTVSKEILKTIQLPFPIDFVWESWTTHEGLKRFFGIENFIELKINGAFEIYFIMNEPYGNRGSETCTIIDFSPYKELIFSWNAPPQFDKVRNSDLKTTVQIHMESKAINQTQLSLRHYDWYEGDDWNLVFVYFENAWDIVLKNLSEIKID